MATGGDTTLDPELVAAVATWFADRELYRFAGVIGERAESGSDDPADRLIAAFGRDPLGLTGLPAAGRYGTVIGACA